MTEFEEVQCQNCGWAGEYGQCLPAKDIGERHTLGDVFSNIECPDCGALCYPDDPTEVSPWWDEEAGAKLLRELADHPEYGPRVRAIKGLIKS